jgi:hypothetical protein
MSDEKKVALVVALVSAGSPEDTSGAIGKLSFLDFCQIIAAVETEITVAINKVDHVKAYCALHDRLAVILRNWPLKGRGENAA